ncbi:hypothetical protein [Marinobacter lutaoensis]|uniref:hypothetical protein n=1 Tax=Marinobacter lutaoensis TaxID=135739 RepID=UPI00111570AE|nr:hypothetical protein [Marinobacter lutaoensis]
MKTNKRALSISGAFLLLLSMPTLALPEDDRFLTSYDKRVEELGQRIKIWNSPRVQSDTVRSIQGLEKDQGSVGLALEGTSLEAFVERLREAPEFQAFESQVGTTSQGLSSLDNLVTTLENSSVWELMEPVFGEWVVTSTSGSAEWSPPSSVALPNKITVQTKDGTATKERMVEIYEKNKKTGEKRLVESYVQSATQYEFDRRSITAGINPDNPEQPIDSNGWTNWEMIGEPYDYKELLPKRSDIWSGMPFNQIQPYKVKEEAYKFIYKDVPDGDYQFIETATQSQVKELYESVRLTGTKPLPGNGCYYDPELGKNTYKVWAKSRGFGAEYIETIVKDNPRFVAKTFYSTNNSSGNNHIITDFYFDGVPIHETPEDSGCSIVCLYSIEELNPMKTWYGATDKGISGQPDPENILPLRTARNGSGSGSSNMVDTNVVLVGDLPFIWDGGRKEFYLGRKMKEDVVTKESWSGGSTWKEYTREYEVCMRNR